MANITEKVMHSIETSMTITVTLKAYNLYATNLHSLPNDTVDTPYCET